MKTSESYWPGVDAERDCGEAGVMKAFFALFQLLLLNLCSLALLQAEEPVTALQDAMTATATVQGPRHGSIAEREAVTRFEHFLAHLDEKTAREQTEQVYAPQAFFNDTLKTLHGSAAIRDYFIRTAQGLESMSVNFEDVAVSGRNYYFRWTMETRMKHLAHGRTVRTTGVTFVRFDPEGRVLVHQDYWDSAQGVWEHVPVMGLILRWIRERI